MSTLSASAWNEAILERGGSFLQSFEWGAFQEALGRRVVRFRYGTFHGQAIEETLPLGIRYLYIPRGPIGAWAELEFDDWLVAFRRHLWSYRPAFLRIDPPLDADSAILRRNGFLDTGRTVQPRSNLIISLAESEEKMLGRMHEKTRYNIRLAAKHHIESRIAHRESRNADAETFWFLLSETARHQGIRLHPKEHYATLLATLPAADSLGPSTHAQQRLYFATYQEKPLAAALVIYFGNRATYVHGGTSRAQKNVMAPYALHWQIMRDAKKAGFTEYDLGGIDEERWPGITRFKQGFGGRAETYLNAHEMPMDKLRYRLFRAARAVIR